MGGLKNMLPQSSWSSRLRRGDDDDGGGDSTDLLQMCSTCDPDDDYSPCITLSGTWSCNITDVAGFTAQLRKIHKMESDDCWTEPRCEGAPSGPQKCKMTQIASD